MSVEPGAIQLASEGGSFLRISVVGLAVAAMGFALCACENTDPAEVEVGTGGAATTTFILEDANNHSARDTLSIPEIVTTPGVDLTLDWTGFTQDLYGRAVAPAADVDSVVLLRFSEKDQGTLTSLVAQNRLALSDIEASFRLTTDHAATTTTLSALLDVNGAPINLEDAFQSGLGHSYLLTLADGATPGLGMRSMTFLKPSTDSTNTVVAVAPGTSAVLTRLVNVGRAPLSVPLTGPWTLDWSGLSRDSVGVELPFEAIDKLVIAYYQGTTAEELMADYFDLETIQTKRWELVLDGKTAATLGGAKEMLADGAVGANFSGFDGMTDGAWLVFLECSSCMSPNPPVLVVLEPTATP